MLNRKAIYGVLTALLALSVILGTIIFYSLNSRDLKVIFLDVGQGDAILISQGQNQMLIDGGQNGKLILEKLGKYIPFWDRTIEVMVATHPDQDHIGGLIDVARSYNVSTVLETKAESNSQTYKAWKEAVDNEGSQQLEAVKNLTIRFPESIEVRVLYPLLPIESSSRSNNNQYSVVMKLISGENKFLLTGDLPGIQEQELISNEIDVSSQILKVAHHGSKYSTSDEFLQAVRPVEAVISVGKNNMYGHPNSEIIQKLLKRGITVWRTDEMGDIIYKCKVQNEKCKVEFN